MFAVIKTGGKQYRVAAEDRITVAKLEGEPGGDVTFGEVLMLSNESGVTVGAPLVSGVTVTGDPGRAYPGREGHRLQEAPPAEFAPQARPSPGLQRRPHHRHQRSGRGEDLATRQPKLAVARRQQIREKPMAHKKAGGSSRNGRDSDGRRLGVKKFGDQAGRRRQHHHPPARHEMARGRQCRHGQGSYPLCHGRRARPLPYAPRPSLRIGRDPVPTKLGPRGRRVNGESETKELPPVSHRTGGSEAPERQIARAPGPKRGGGMPPPLRRFGVPRRPLGSEQRHVSRPHPRRRLPARNPPPLAALAAPRRRAGHRPPRRRESGRRDDGPHPASLCRRTRSASFSRPAKAMRTATGSASRSRPKGRPESLIGCVGIEPRRARPASPISATGSARRIGARATPPRRRGRSSTPSSPTRRSRELTSAARVINPASRRVIEKCGFAFLRLRPHGVRGAGRLLPGRPFPPRPAGLGEPQDLGPHRPRARAGGSGCGPAEPRRAVRRGAVLRPRLVPGIG